MRFFGRRQSAVAVILLLYAALFLPLMIPPRPAQDARTNNYYHYERVALFRSIGNPTRDAIDLSPTFRLSKDDQSLLLDKINSQPGQTTFSIEDRSRSLQKGNFAIDFVSRIPAAERLILRVKPNPTELRKLCKCVRLKGLVVDGWTDDHLRAISEQACWQLSSLGVSGKQLSSDGFRRLASHRELHTLNLSGTMVSAADCIFLLAALPHLQELDISGTSVSGFSAVDTSRLNLTPLSALTTLRLSDTSVSAADCIFLMSVLPHLQELDISHTSVSGFSAVDASRLNMAALSSLETLDLYGANVSDADCVFLLNGLPQLQKLDISHTNLSDAVEAAILHSKITTLGALGTQLSSTARQRMRDRGIEVHDVN